MQVYGKARELGNLILSSEQSLRLSDAKYAYENDEQSRNQLEEYKAYQNEIQCNLENGLITPEDFKEASKKLTDLGATLKKHPIIGELIASETAFNTLVNEVMAILKATITGQEDNGCSSCSGKSCDSCH